VNLATRPLDNREGLAFEGFDEQSQPLTLLT
jgi:hypothetical protein